MSVWVTNLLLRYYSLSLSLMDVKKKIINLWRSQEATTTRSRSCPMNRAEKKSGRWFSSLAVFFSRRMRKGRALTTAIITISIQKNKKRDMIIIQAAEGPSRGTNRAVVQRDSLTFRALLPGMRSINSLGKILPTRSIRPQATSFLLVM